MSMAVAGAVMVGGGAAAGGYMSANTPNAMSIDEWANALVYGDLSADREQRDIGSNMYKYGTANPWQTIDGKDPATAPYKSAYDGGYGYYVDKRGRVISQDVYNKKSKEGRSKDAPGQNWEWVPVTQKNDNATHFLASGEKAPFTPYNAVKQNTPDGKEAFGSFKDTQTGEYVPYETFIANPQAYLNNPRYQFDQVVESKTYTPQGMDESNNQWLGEMQPKAQAYASDQLEAAHGLLPFQTDAARAEYQYTIDTTPEKSLADIATYQYTQEAMPEKWSLVQTMSEMAKRNTESEAARMAGAEVSQEYNLLGKTLGDNIRRTGAVAGSGRMAGLQADMDLNRVKDTAGAKVAARTAARNNQYEQLSKAVQLI